MIAGRRVLAIVPARGGSKGIRLKNLREVGGISLVARAGILASEVEEIDRAVVEMLDRLGGAADSPVQVQFREAATEAAERLRDRFAYVRKWGTDDGFLGDGGVALFAGPV